MRTRVGRFGWFSYMPYNFLRWFSWCSPFFAKMDYCSSAHLGRFFLTRCHRKIHNFCILNRIELNLGVHMRNMYPNMYTKFQADWLLHKKIKSIKLSGVCIFSQHPKNRFSRVLWISAGYLLPINDIRGFSRSRNSMVQSVCRKNASK